MIRNFFKIAFRNIVRQKFYALINIFGLAIGLAICLLILLFVKDELSYDRHHEKADRIYRTMMEWGHNEDRVKSPINPYRLAPALKVDFPELDPIVRISPTYGGLVQYDDLKYQEQQMYFADQELFELFDFKLLKGDPATVLAEPYAVVVSETIARKYFGEENAIGKVLNFNNQYDATVTGVFEDFTPNNHFVADIFISMETGESVFNQLVLNNWGEMSCYTYFALPEGSSAESFNDRFSAFIEKNVGEGRSEAMGISLQPLTDIHLHSNYRGEIQANSDIRYIYISSAIALFIILIACINYMNLATARSVKRSLEIGVRKTLGAAREALAGQFLAESVMVAVFALVLAFALASLAMPAFNAFVGKSLSTNPFVNPDIFLLFVLITLGVGLLAGSYPALYLSSFRAIRAFQEKASTGSSGRLRKVLVVFQFAISIILILGTLVIYQQWNYLRTKDIGYNKENLVLVPIPNLSQYESLKNQLKQNPDILDVAASNKRLTSPLSSNLGFKAEQFEVDQHTRPSIKIVTVDHDFMKALQIPIAAGRDFSRQFGADDSTAFILNQAAVDLIGWEEPVGKWFETSEFFNGGWRTRKGTVIGVIKGYNHESLYNEIKPTVYFISSSWLNWMSIRISGQNVSNTLADIKDKWVQFGSEELYTYSFADDRIAQLYLAEERFFKIFTLFTLLAIFIASLGILGLSAFTAEQRTKEIGVRKVFGATAGNIVVLLSKEFTKLVLIGLLIAAPLSYFLLENWLQDFTYRIEIGWWPFVIAGIVALLMAWLTAGFQSLRAALANPIKSLRYE